MRTPRFAPFFASLSLLLLAACSDSSDPAADLNNQPLAASAVSMTLNGAAWTSQVVQIQGNIYSATGSSGGGNGSGGGTGGGGGNGTGGGTGGSSGTMGFTLNNITAAGDVPFNNALPSGPHASVVYVDSKSGQSVIYSNIVEDGSAKFTVTKVTDAELRGTFNCTLKAESGAAVTITNGSFAFKLK